MLLTVSILSTYMLLIYENKKAFSRRPFSESVYSLQRNRCLLLMILFKAVIVNHLYWTFLKNLLRSIIFYLLENSTTGHCVTNLWFTNQLKLVQQILMAGFWLDIEIWIRIGGSRKIVFCKKYYQNILLSICKKFYRYLKLIIVSTVINYTL